MEARKDFNEGSSDLIYNLHGDKLDVEMKEFLDKCLQKDPECRSSVQTLLKTTWILEPERQKHLAAIKQKEKYAKYINNIEKRCTDLRKANHIEWAFIQAIVSLDCLKDMTLNSKNSKKTINAILQKIIDWDLLKPDGIALKNLENTLSRLNSHRSDGVLNKTALLMITTLNKKHILSKSCLILLFNALQERQSNCILSPNKSSAET